MPTAHQLKSQQGTDKQSLRFAKSILFFLSLALMIEIVSKRVFMLRKEDLNSRLQNSLWFTTTWRRVKISLDHILGLGDRDFRAHSTSSMILKVWSIRRLKYLQLEQLKT